MTLPTCSICGGEAVIFCPGAEGDAIDLAPGVAVPVRRPVPDRAWCMADARAAGWPNWQSERAGTRGRVRR